MTWWMMARPVSCLNIGVIDGAVATGDSTADIARGMFLSRRTVQTYISRILVKLDGRSRVDIVREALRQEVSP
jgi:DNA-binding CsgD family transcriptional regulator